MLSGSTNRNRCGGGNVSTQWALLDFPRVVVVNEVTVKRESVAVCVCGKRVIAS